MEALRGAASDDTDDSDAKSAPFPIAAGDVKAQILALAEACGWPSVPLAPHLSVVAGEFYWRRFVATASAEQLATALLVLRQMAEGKEEAP